MGNIVPINSDCRIWSVTNLLSTEQAEEIRAVDWLAMPWHRGHMQKTWPRRWIDNTHADIVKFKRYINHQLPAINQAMGTDYSIVHAEWWIDEPGFRVGIHTDGELLNSMQMTWLDIGPAHGTAFYQDKRGEQLIWSAPGKVNTGYIMLNHRREDGSQPLLWHGMINPVPKGVHRLTCYCTFYK